MGEPGERGVSTIAGGVALEWVRSSCNSSSSSSVSCTTNEGTGTRVPTAEATPPESKEREADPWRNSFRSRDRHSSQNTADISQGLLQRKHWLICNSSHLPGRLPNTGHERSRPTRH